MPTVKATTITVDSLLPRPKLDYDVGYDAAMKGASVVLCGGSGEILILLCSLKTYLSFETWKYLQENMGYLIHLSFFRRASKYPLF